MRRKFVFLLVIIIVISLIICQSTLFKSNINISENEAIMKKVIHEKYKILQSGVKFQYSVKNNLVKEKNRIADILELSKNEFIVNENGFYFNKKINKDDYLIKGSYINNNESFIEIELIKNNENDIENLKKKFEKVQNNLTSNEQYFSFIKGKLKLDNEDEKIRINNILEKKGVQNQEEINLHNGTTAIIEFKDKTKINYSLCNYNTGQYLIIGTPNIFITY